MAGTAASVGGGAATGAAGGAAIGPEGAAAGAAVGAAGGAKKAHDTKKAAKAARDAGGGGGQSGSPAANNSSSPSASEVYGKGKKYGREAKRYVPGPTTKGGRGSNPRRMLVAEFVVCTVILALSPLSAKHKDDDVVKWMARGGAISVVFLVLGLVAAISDKAGRVAAAMGLTIMVGLLVSDADVFQNFLAGLQVPKRKEDGIAPGTGDVDVPPSSTQTPPGAVGGVGGEGNFNLGFDAPPNWNPLGGG
jgi:hypothetical protein